MSSALLTVQDSDWNVERLAFNILVDQQPAGIACPSTAGEVSDIVRAAAARMGPPATGAEAVVVAAVPTPGGTRRRFENAHRHHLPPLSSGCSLPPGNDGTTSH